MYSTEDIERIKLISKKINTILDICDNAGGIVKALEDEILYRPAILMHLIACNEQLQKIQDNLNIEILTLFSKEDIKGFRGIRNAIAHDYEGVNLPIIEEIIRSYLPNIKEKIDKFVREN